MTYKLVKKMCTFRHSLNLLIMFLFCMLIRGYCEVHNNAKIRFILILERIEGIYVIEVVKCALSRLGSLPQ